MTEDHEVFVRDGLLGIVLYVLLGFAVLVCAVDTHGCASLSDSAVVSALDAYRTTLQPAQDLLRLSCDQVEKLAVLAEREGRATPAQTDQVLADSRTRCDAAAETFEQMRLVHERAADAYEKGNLRTAREGLETLAAMWVDLEAPDGGLAR